MEREEPMGYVCAHPEKKFQVLTNKRNFIIECTAKRDGKLQKVSDDCEVSFEIMLLKKKKKNHKMKYGTSAWTFVKCLLFALIDI